MAAVVVLSLIACKDSTGPANDPLPPLLPGDGVIRFTLGASCPTLTLRFGIGTDDGNGPETLDPRGSKQYAVPARIYATWARTMDESRIFPTQNVTVVAGERVTRTLDC